MSRFSFEQLFDGCQRMCRLAIEAANSGRLGVAKGCIIAAIAYLDETEIRFGVIEAFNLLSEDDVTEALARQFHINCKDVITLAYADDDRGLAERVAGVHPSWKRTWCP